MGALAPPDAQQPRVGRALRRDAPTLAALSQYEKRCAKCDGCIEHYYCSFRMTDTCPWWQIRNGLYERLVKVYPEVLDRASMLFARA